VAGNIRELQNAIERGLITCEGALVTAAHLAISLPSERTILRQQPEPVRPAASPWTCTSWSERRSWTRSSARMVTRRARGSLGLTRFQLYSRLKRYDIEVSPE
jgi:DNA-binding NtrC family response regulator